MVKLLHLEKLDKKASDPIETDVLKTFNRFQLKNFEKFAASAAFAPRSIALLILKGHSPHEVSDL